MYNKPRHLSPTSLALYRQNPDDYFMRYLSDHKPPRFPQTEPMSVGSAFDAYIKSDINVKLFGSKKDPKFDFEVLFEAQVEPHNRDKARKDGKLVYDAYVASGSLTDLMLELESAIGTPRLESEVFGVVNGQREGMDLTIGGVPFLGKPDVFFINKAGAHVILDWKVNGFYSNWGASPAPGYTKLREIGKVPKSHKDCQISLHEGVMINIAQTLDQTAPEWSDQLSIYSWICGEQVGSRFIAAIDQIVCRSGNMRFAQHRALVAPEHQWKLFEYAKKVWEIVNSDWIFREFSIEESQTRCKMLNQAHQAPSGPEDELFQELTRPR